MSRASMDKLLACLNYAVRGKAAKEWPMYFAACSRWFDELTAKERETVWVVIDCYAGPRRDAAESIADALPSAPACPF